MSSWTSGYISDIDYTYGYYSELNPLRAQFALVNAGFVTSQIENACELGFGQGVSINIHAAGGSTRWFGTDFNPGQAGFAHELASAAGTSAKLLDEAFSDFAARNDLPDFDFVGLHGIWSWISDQNRTVIVDFLRRKLKVGGVLYISYNTHPGWAAFVPMRHLLALHEGLLSAKGSNVVNRIDDALAFGERLLATNPLFGRANPAVGERLKRMGGQSRQYLAHEYFNQNWNPMHFSELSKSLEAAKLRFACSAHYLDHVDAVNLTAEQQALLGEIQSPLFRETVRDFMVNQQFRRDLWVKGARKLSPLERADTIRSSRIVLTAPRAEVSLKVTGALGEATMHENVYGPFLDIIADNKPKTLGQIEQTLAGRGINLAQIHQATLVLGGAGSLAPAQEDSQIGKAHRQTEKLNAHLRHKARGGADISFLASPITGGGIQVDRVQQLFLTSLSQGRKQPSEWAHGAWQILAAQGHRLLKDGKALESADENLAELVARAATFAEKQLPVLRALQVA